MKRLLVLCTAVILLTACGKKKTTSHVKDNPTEPTVLLNTFEPPADEEWFAIGAMEGAGAFTANGVAQAGYKSDGTYFHSMQLNVSSAPDTYFYEVWLMNDDGDAVSAGELKPRFKDVRHFVQFDVDQDLRKHTNVVVTLEKVDGNPEKSVDLVATGTLKPRKR